MRRVSLMAVVIGGIVDVGGTTFAGLPVVFYVMATNNIPTLPRVEQGAVVMAFIKGHTIIYLLLGAAGCLCSILGGYVSAIIARRSEVLNAALSSYLCLALGVRTLISGTQQLPTWLFLLLLPLSPILAAFGGYLRLMQNRSAIAGRDSVLPGSAA